MLLSGAPTKTTVPFANSGAKNTIPVAASATPGLASYTTGFPALTMTPLSAGGIPPAGQDFNGILNAISQAVQYYSAGTAFAYDSTFSSAVSGYPKGAVLQKATGTGLWFNTTDANTTNPDSGGAGWLDVTGGRLYRTLIYINVGSTTNVQCSIDGGAFTALSTYTPTANLVRQKLRGCGAGGGGGGTPATSTGQAAASPGGGAGSFFERTLIGSNLIASAIAISPGIGGLGSAGAAGFNGTSTVVGSSLIVAPGGGGGNVPAAFAGTQIVGGTSGGAAGSGGDINAGGQPGGGAQSIAGARAVAGNGGSSPYGAGGAGQQDNTAGTQASGYGSGGSGRAVGASVAATAGNPGMNGIVIIEEFL